MPSLSLVIPTHDRQAYAEHAVRIAARSLSDCQIVVSDTSATEDLRSSLADLIALGRVTYVRPEEALDVVSHFEFALSHADGEYVMFIGDDDSVGPGVDAIVAWARENAVEAIAGYGKSFICNYFWPNIVSRYFGTGYASSLFVNSFTGRARLIDGKSELRRALDDIGRGLGMMPRIYHGIVSRALIDRIIRKHGALFGGVTPDIYSAALISLEATRSAHVDFPFCIPGGSPPSTAGSGAARSDIHSLRDHPHIRPFGALRWNALIPEYYAPHVVWAYSLSEAMNLYPDFPHRPRLTRLYARGLLFDRASRKAIWSSVGHHRTALGERRTMIALAIDIIREGGFQAMRFARRLRAPRAGGSARRYRNLPTIDGAYTALGTHITRYGSALRLEAIEQSDRRVRS